MLVGRPMIRLRGIVDICARTTSRMDALLAVNDSMVAIFALC